MISHYKQSELPTLPSLFYFELFLSLASYFLHSVSWFHSDAKRYVS